MNDDPRNVTVDRAVLASAVFIGVLGLAVPIAATTHVIPTWQLVLGAVFLSVACIVATAAVIARSGRKTLRHVLASGLPTRSDFPRPWLWVIEGALFIGCYAPVSPHAIARRVIGAACGAALFAFGVARGQNRAGIGTAMESDPDQGRYAAWFLCLVGGAMVIYWAFGLVDY